MGDDLPWNLNILDPMDDDFGFRFMDVSKDGVDELIAQRENENTKKKTIAIIYAKVVVASNLFFHSYLTDRRQFLRKYARKSNLALVDFGVLQGSRLGSLTSYLYVAGDLQQTQHRPCY
ncbi:unnamed protein product [Porites lobata]|uniref:Uncharacterized protein n=1 Tax=Porites lobata TaxID=104759 RepID=A0ABN8R731_9CNID|nr:unnamed protein product [Porites lobata]